MDKSIEIHVGDNSGMVSKTILLDDLGPVLTVSVDLAQTLDLDQGRAWVGFTAATGGGWQNHDIQNWR